MSEAKAQHYRQHPANEGNPDAQPGTEEPASEQIAPPNILAAAQQRFLARHSNDQGEAPNEKPEP